MSKHFRCAIPVPPDHEFAAAPFTVIVGKFKYGFLTLFDSHHGQKL
ncbi:hypothetical protein TUM12147_29430 [Citrobacter europaeus]|nr:hypothetical protein TUM12147_29430 [Citrobacter europaeus]GIZ21571.1 hypothetical protein TUM12148_02350 [Citrobacter europaeus]